MAKPQRKILRTTIKLDTDQPCAPSDDCHDLPPPPPPHTHLSPFLIFMFCSLAVVVTFVCYLTLLKLLRRNSRRRGGGNVAGRGETHQDLIDEDHGPVVNHPIWLINTVGLDPSVIDAIEVFKYKTGEGLIEAADCSVCLGEFRDDESLRLLPKCSHAFHVSCIDTWLRSHTNCPLCRAPIVKNAATLDESSSHEENPVVGSETVDDSRGNESNEVDNAVDENSNGVGRELPPVRRSVSMDHNSAFVVDKAQFGDQERGIDPKTENFSNKNIKGHTRSSSGIGMYSRVMKSSSFGRSSRKASGSSSG